MARPPPPQGCGGWHCWAQPRRCSQLTNAGSGISGKSMPSRLWARDPSLTCRCTGILKSPPPPPSSFTPQPSFRPTQLLSRRSCGANGWVGAGTSAGQQVLLPQGPRQEVARGGCAAAGVVCQRMSAEACAALNVISPAPLRMQQGAGRQPRQGRTQQRAGAGCRRRRQARRRLCGGPPRCGLPGGKKPPSGMAPLLAASPPCAACSVMSCPRPWRHQLSRGECTQGSP